MIETVLRVASKRTCAKGLRSQWGGESIGGPLAREMKQAEASNAVWRRSYHCRQSLRVLLAVRIRIAVPRSSKETGAAMPTSVLSLTAVRPSVRKGVLMHFQLNTG